MVLATLFEQFGNSERGLLRRDIPGIYAREFYRLPLSDDTNNSQNEDASSFLPATKPKRKRCRASKFLSSVAADFDVVTDWLFYYHTLCNDREYRSNFLQNPVEGKTPYLIPPFLIWIILIVCILGTIMWLVLATDGAVIAPILRLCGVDKLSMGFTLILCVMVEDIPQIILTFLIEDYYEGEDQLTNVAIVSVVASFYDTLIKLAEAYDERGDVVETGIWCKESLWAHKKSISGIISIPLEEVKEESELSLLGSSQSRVHIKSNRQSKKFSVLDQAKEIVAETKLPRLTFLSVSLDRTIRVWDTTAKVDGHKRDKCIKTIRGHTKGVTCLSFLGDLRHHRRKRHNPNHSELHFLTGSRDGTVKLWNLSGTCIRTYSYIHSGSGERAEVTSIAYLNREKTFVCGYNNGLIRCWGTATGDCLALFDGHKQNFAINSVCSIEDSYSFISASDDASIRLWDASNVSSTNLVDNITSDNQDSSSIIIGSEIPASGKNIIDNKISSKTFLGHSGPVLALACVEPEIAFLSGSSDRTARLWSIESGACLRVFAGHADAVTTVRPVDQVTFLTGSDDTTIKVWDAFSTCCIRTYTGHTQGVTDISTSQDGTFISCSKDQTIKLWVFTAVIPMDEEE